MSAPSRYPLAWPAGWKRSTVRGGMRSGNFKVTFDKALKDLSDEIERMGGRYPLISSNVELRLDGQMRRDKGEPVDRGVAVYFEHKGQQKVFACDTFTTVRDNIRAIGLTIAALRSIERYGASAMLERALSAFEALPAPNSQTWRDVLELSKGGAVDRDMIETQFRRLAVSRHPDRSGGSHEAMSKLNAARDAALREISGGAL